MKAVWLQKIRETAQMPVAQRLAVVALFGTFLWFLVLGDQGFYQLKKLSNIRDQLQAKEVELTESNEELRQDKLRYQKPENLEMAIRRELGFIRPGEIVYRAQSDDTAHPELIEGSHGSTASP